MSKAGAAGAAGTAGAAATTEPPGTTTWIAFLRAVNVGGRVVRMERLRELFGELGLTGVGSYIQSGNVFFRGEAGLDRAALTARLEQHLEQALGFPVPVLLRTVDEVAAVLAAEPFAGVEVTPEVRLNVVFLSEPLPAGLALPVTSPKGNLELVSATAGEAFVVWRIVNGRPPSGTDSVFGKEWRGHGTSRFLHTLEKILAAARKGAK
ncbi:DUF1697 domain-containing protein [Streptomyces tateyamensis]|uniref:DUF1697 domain-containing protein n=1 Tax=Streptomyces tateyamensis TaxID=565073 RepID=A0A2V4P0V8_9ACTN|nr:DUF1697 domain-containing protein [Streptomyces tateyamensis]PYC77811.1 DUF1697 domain-containing protein [Streptomyces tateyamensis]